MTEREHHLARLEAFLRHVSFGAPDECWLTAATPSHRYGKVTINYEHEMLHRIAYELTFGPIPDGLLIRHTCDNTRCCNPRHMLTGTHDDNMRDMAERRRQGRLKLSDEQVHIVRESGESERALAARFGVSKTAIHKIKVGENHRHVPLRLHVNMDA